MERWALQAGPQRGRPAWLASAGAAVGVEGEEEEVLSLALAAARPEAAGVVEEEEAEVRPGVPEAGPWAPERPATLGLRAGPESQEEAAGEAGEAGRPRQLAWVEHQGEVEAAGEAEGEGRLAGPAAAHRAVWKQWAVQAQQARQARRAEAAEEAAEEEAGEGHPEPGLEAAAGHLEAGAGAEEAGAAGRLEAHAQPAAPAPVGLRAWWVRRAWWGFQGAGEEEVAEEAPQEPGS